MFITKIWILGPDYVTLFGPGVGISRYPGYLGLSYDPIKIECRYYMYTFWRAGIQSMKKGTSTLFKSTVHSMHLGPIISGVELDFLSAWRRRDSLSYTLWRTGVKECRSRRTVLLIFALQVYANLQPWRSPEDLLA